MVAHTERSILVPNMAVLAFIPKLFKTVLPLIFHHFAPADAPRSAHFQHGKRVVSRQLRNIETSMDLAMMLTHDTDAKL